MESSPEDDVAVYHIIQREASSPRNALTTGALTPEASNASRSLDPVSNTRDDGVGEDDARVVVVVVVVASDRRYRRSRR